MTLIENLFHSAGLPWLLARATAACMLPEPSAREAITEEIASTLREGGVPADLAREYARLAVLLAGRHLQEVLAPPVV